jgi:leucyl/phenylalanyl-tRNA--protein transferase
MGQALFGESMFALQTDASKIALAALVAFAKAHQVTWIDCQQNTQHLASLGAFEIPRRQLLDNIQIARQEPALAWEFQPIYWNELMPPKHLP